MGLNVGKVVGGTVGAVDDAPLGEALEAKAVGVEIGEPDGPALGLTVSPIVEATVGFDVDEAVEVALGGTEGGAVD
jgi:hypothetical protein